MALSWSGRSPVRFPITVGLKVMLMVQVPYAARLDPQVFVCAKSPETGIATKFTGAPPLLVTFKILAWLAVPTFCARNFRLDGAISNAPGVAVAVGVAVGVGVLVAVAVLVAVGVEVLVAVAVRVAVGVAVLLAVAVPVGVSVGVGVSVAADDGVALGSGVGEGAELLMR
jgi:hypothetical protein